MRLDMVRKKENKNQEEYMGRVWVPGSSHSFSGKGEHPSDIYFQSWDVPSAH
jgi:hypothetical protein